MTNKEAIKYLQQLYPNGGHCWLDEQRIEAIDMAVNALQEEPASEKLEKIVEEIAVPTILNAYGTKELARRLRNTICGTSITNDLGEYINELSKQFPEVSFAKLSRIAVRVAKWQKQKDNNNANHALVEQIKTQQMCYEKGMADMKQQMMAKAIDGDITFDYYGDDDKTYGCIAHDSFCLEDFELKDRDKVKMILIKEEKL